MCHLERLSKPFCEAYGVAIIEESRKRNEQKKTHTQSILIIKIIR